MITFSFLPSIPNFPPPHLNIARITALVQEAINLQTSVPMPQNDWNGTQGDTSLFMFLYCFIRTELFQHV